MLQCSEANKHHLCMPVEVKYLPQPGRCGRSRASTCCHLLREVAACSIMCRFSYVHYISDSIMEYMELVPSLRLLSVPEQRNRPTCICHTALLHDSSQHVI